MAGHRPCRFFVPGNESSCRYGSRCSFLHQQSEVKESRRSFSKSTTDSNWRSGTRRIDAIESRRSYQDIDSGGGWRFSQQRDLGGSWRGNTSPNGKQKTTSFNLPQSRALPLATNDPEFDKWRKLLSSSRLEDGKLSKADITQFVEIPLRLLDKGAPDQIQKVAKLLADENGLQVIKQIVETDFQTESYMGLDFFDHGVGLLRVLSHGAFKSSLILEKDIGTVFNVIYSPSGKRGISFFTMAINHLDAIWTKETTAPRHIALQAISSTLLQLMEFNQAAPLQSDFEGLVRKLHGLYKGLDGESYEARLVSQTLHDLAGTLKIAEELFPLKAVQPLVVKNQQFSKRLGRQHGQFDPPGELSPYGPRHGNDHSDIAGIRIFPTIEEIMSERDEYLPSPDDAHHLSGLARHLDIQFRLLREETTGQLRDAIRKIRDLKILNDNGTVRSKEGLSKKLGTAVRFYEKAKAENLKMHHRCGLSLAISFEQPDRVRGLRKNERAQWWKDTKDLTPGTLLIVMKSTSDFFFAVIAERQILYSPPQEDDGEREAPLNARQEVQDLASNETRAGITIALADPNNPFDMIKLITLASKDVESSFVLLDFPGTMQATFEPILRCLQDLSLGENLPFQDIIANDSGQHHVPRCPEYLLDSALDLSCILNPGEQLILDPLDPFPSKELEMRSSLDSGQCASLLSALSSEFSLIQGPPGTGKSYVGVQIMRVLHKFDAGPILCVCYTNHALDQFLEHLLDNGIEDIIRIGSGSKSDRLKELTLRGPSRNSYRTKEEQRSIWEHRRTMDELEINIRSYAASLKHGCRLSDLEEYMIEKGLVFTLINSDDEEFFESDEDGIGWETVRRTKSTGSKLKQWLHHKPISTTDSYTSHSSKPVQELLKADPWSLAYHEKQKLKGYWEECWATSTRIELRESVEKFNDLKANVDKIYKEADRRTLQSTEIIGVTTTGFALHSELLRSIDAKVLICEEAGEVLEAHILSALIPSVQHAILIGDHLQLRPKVSRYDLSMESSEGKAYRLDMSLFERLVNPDGYSGSGPLVPVSQLDTQRRMHPSIAELVRAPLYPTLKDHPSTLERETVPGMRHRLYWMDHQNFEDAHDFSEPGSKSKTNEWEADMVVSLVRHIQRQGKYKRSEIAVLTPYLAQLRVLRRKLSAVCDLMVGERDLEDLSREDLSREVDDTITPSEVRNNDTTNLQIGNLIDGLRLSTSDNFQGEEARIIIISLVRSNAQGKIGFLKTFNRINVILSRARDGMYIFGNVRTALRVKMWEQVFGILDTEKCLGSELHLQCKRHPDNMMTVRKPDDFAIVSPEGGCGEMCGWRLDCGHTCGKKCHTWALHELVSCMNPCQRLRECGHSCPKKCGEKCGDCMVKLPNVALPGCGHKQTIFCVDNNDLFAVKCRTQVTKASTTCRHEHTVSCSKDMKDHVCNRVCGSDLPCGHQCRRKCFECKTAPDEDGVPTAPVHGKCTARCGRKFTTCSHSCTSPCHGIEPCKPCSAPCEIRCLHSSCAKTCAEPCPPCAEPCSQPCGWTCPHREKCDMPCAVPCEAIPCSLRCENRLLCGHQCPSICGEKCPDSVCCRICASQEILEATVDFYSFESYGEIDLDVDPVIFLDCGHYYTVSNMDKHLNFGDREAVDNLAVRKGCPVCRSTIRNIARYNRNEKLAMLEESTKRFSKYAQSELDAIFQSCSDLLTPSSESENIADYLSRTISMPFRNAFSSALMEFDSSERYQKYLATSKRLAKYLSSVSRDQQPFARVHALALSARKTRGTGPGFKFDESKLQFGFEIRGTILQLQITTVHISEMSIVVKRWPLNGGRFLSKEQFKDRRFEWADKWVVKPLRDAEKMCRDIIQKASNSSFVRQQVEAKILLVEIIVLSLEMHKHLRDASTQKDNAASMEESREEARSLIEECKAICLSNPGSTRGLLDKAEAALKAVNEGVFYSSISVEEIKDVFAAMQRNFSGTGHWYYCTNGHIFTIGECGMPMELARCFECGEQIGGYDHSAIEGVRRAEDLEATMVPADF